MRQEKKVGGTKRALLTSVLALVLSLAMLAGSTFAWFTDTASTGVNRIVSGNLDVGLQYWGVGEDGQKTWLTAESSEELFDENALWEPGYTQIVYLKVKNNGNLALTYAMQITPVRETVGINVDGEQFKLSDYIKFAWTTFTADGDGAPVALDREGAQAGVGEGAQLGTTLHRQAAEPMEAGAEELVALVAWMPENVGNEANYSTVQPTIELSLKVLATQAAVESDSFDTTYDEDAAAAEDLNNKPEYDYESLYDYDNLKGYGVTVERNEAGKVVKATVSGVNGKVVDGFFYNNKPGTEATPIDRWRDLKEVVIEEGVTEIGVDAFSVCTSLETVTLPQSLQKIGEKAFSYCTSLKTINIPDSVNVIGPKAFYFCKSLTSIGIPEGITEIGYATFGYAENLTTVNIPASVTRIGDFAFQNCGFTSMDVPATVKELGEGAFSTCRSLENVTVPAETVSKKAFYFCDALKSVTLTDDVKTIGEEAFRQCTSLESIEIPSSVTELGTCAFKNCFALKTAVIKGGTVKGSLVTEATFYNCNALETLVISDNATLDASFKAAYSKSTLKTVKIGKGEIGNSAFSNCTNLTTVELGDGVTSIGTSAFLKCKQLSSIAIGSGVISIGTSAFNGCTALTNANIGSGAIGESAFNGCTSLANVTLGNGVTSIGKNAFLRCTALTSISIGSGVTSIGSGAFNGCTELRNANIGSGAIGANAFQDCSRLASVTLGDGVTSIGTNAFLKCTALTSMYIGSSVKTIESYAFSTCSSLSEVTISAAQIGNQAFRSANALKKVTLGDGVETIPAGAFSNCGMGNKNNSPELYLKAGTWTSNGQETTVAEGASITTGNRVFNQIKSGKPATWSAPVNP